MSELEFPEHLPAILVGVPGLRLSLANELPWAHSVHHQHGGYACLQAQFYGAVLPLSAVPACSALTAGFDALALASPSKSAFAGVPELRSLHLSSGKPYQQTELAAIQRFLGRADFSFPRLTGGTEALLELAAASSTAFLGWSLLMLEMPPGSALDDPDARHLDIGRSASIRGGFLRSQPFAGSVNWSGRMFGRTCYGTTATSGQFPTRRHTNVTAERGHAKLAGRHLMKLSPIRFHCNAISYRRGMIEVATIHPRCVNIEAWDVSAERAGEVTPSSDIPADAIVANTELELTADQARELAAALLAAADAAVGESA